LVRTSAESTPYKGATSPIPLEPLLLLLLLLLLFYYYYSTFTIKISSRNITFIIIVSTLITTIVTHDVIIKNVK